LTNHLFILINSIFMTMLSDKKKCYKALCPLKLQEKCCLAQPTLSNEQRQATETATVLLGACLCLPLSRFAEDNAGMCRFQTWWVVGRPIGDIKIKWHRDTLGTFDQSYTNIFAKLMSWEIESQSIKGHTEYWQEDLL